MKFTINNKILEEFFNLNLGILVIKNIDNTQTNEKLNLYYKDIQTNLQSSLKKEDVQSNEEILAWRKAYSWMKAKPKKYKCSIEALYRRILNGDLIPPINPLVDMYNAISLKYSLPVGGDNLDNIEGDISLDIAKGDEKFTPIGASDSKHPSEAEVIYKDEKDVLCRRWNWREGDKTKITKDTSNVVIYIESLISKDNVENALKELQSKLKEFFNLETEYFILDRINNSFDFDNNTLIKNDQEIIEKVIEDNSSKKKRDKKNKQKQNQNNQKIHWADKIALEVKKRIEKNPQVKEIYEKHGALVYDEKTPSGTIHIGSARGWLIHDLIAKALRKLGINSKFILSSDDMDPYDKPNKELDNTWDKYLGMPFMDIPSPVEGYKSFGDYYFSLVTEKFEEFGIECELESTGEKYCEGLFDPMIKKILDNHLEVQGIYTKLYGDTPAAHKIPFNVKCPKCGKIATTIATEWDKEKELLTFECREDVVEWAQGCGEKGQISPYKGNGKFPWKVEWAAKWPTKNVVVEYAGKDHFTQGGSRTFSCHLATSLLNYPSPFPSSGYKTGPGYEFFTIGGKKMSTSKGAGMSFRGASETLPMQIIRYLLVKSRPNSVIDFDPYQSNDLVLLFDRFDKCERIYFDQEEKVSHGEVDLQKRIYELSCTSNIPKKCPIQVPLSLAGIIMQVALNDIEKAIEILKQQKHIPSEISDEDLLAVKDRLTFAKHWIEDFAEEQYKFQLIDEPDKTLELDDKLKSAVKKLSESLKQKKFDEKSLFEEFYNICQELEIKNTDFFTACYKILINKEKGPKLAPFILTIGQNKVAEIFNKI